MHRSAYRFGKQFLELYIGSAPSRILDVGSYNVNGSLRDHALAEYEYIGVDMAAGPGVDIVLDDPNILPFPDHHFDAIVTSSVFEHSVFFWLIFLEITRVCKNQGFIYLNAPTNGLFHQYPYDFWRFYPDAGIALASWASHNGYGLALVESGVAYKQDDVWNDFVAVFQKSVPVTHRGPMIVDDASHFMNIRRHDKHK